ncbi:MFS transporter [Bdellovibrio reynosensis]|uniref:MFS transporter n=1 Tax=Bdellovibrio reynosensis TaxID=2835041 RepID=A0ABY4C7J6_9BACT|nr:MFS transporter [Bdellovibrio reynosensis]UOF00434.1 MFS transporter [Bdellovibrio reynosensis]
MKQESNLTSGGHTGLWDIAGFSCFATLISYYAYYVTGIYFLEISKGQLDTGDIGIIASSLSYAGGFILRPIGGMYYGALSDLRGKKLAFVRALKFLAIVSFSFIFIDVDILGPKLAVTLVMVLRLVQGFFMGGASTLGLIYLYQLSPDNEKGKFTSLLQMSAPAGYVSAIALILITRLVFPAQELGHWGWRIAYAFCGFLYPIAMYVDKNFPDIKSHTISEWNVETFKNHLHGFFGDTPLMKRILTFPLLVTASAGVMFFFFIVFRGYFMGPVLKLSTDQSSFIIGISSLLALPFFPVFGWMSDNYGRLKFVFSGIILGALFFIPFFKGLEFTNLVQDRYMEMITLIVIYGILLTLSQASLAALLCDLMPKQYIGLAFGFTYNFGLILLGAVLQTMTTSYFEQTGDIYHGLQITLGVIVVCGILAFFTRPKNSNI